MYPSNYLLFDITSRKSKTLKDWGPNLLPLFFSFSQIFQPVPSFDSSRYIGLQILVTKGISNQKWNGFLELLLGIITHLFFTFNLEDLIKMLSLKENTWERCTWCTMVGNWHMISFCSFHFLFIFCY